MLVAGGLVVHGWRHGAPRQVKAVTFDAQTPLSTLVPALRDSDGRALTALVQRLTAKSDTPAAAIRDEAEAADWLNTLAALRSGYLRFGAYARANALTVATRILDRFAIDRAPASWPRALPVMHLEPPDDSLLRGVLVKLFADRQLIVDESLIAYVMTRIERSFAAARAAVAELDSEALRRQRPVTRALAAETLGQFEP